jgi:hypothetical protein
MTDAVATTDTLPAFPEQLDAEEVDRLQKLWPNFDPGQRDRLLQVAQKLAAARAELAALEAEARRRTIIARNQHMIQLLDQWQAEDAAGDHEAQEADWEALKQALNEDRLSDRPLFR